VINFDNPAFFYLHQGEVRQLETRAEIILDRKILITTGQLQWGDFLGAASDGILYAGMGVTLNFGWGWQAIADFIQEVITKRPPRMHTASTIVREVIQKTLHLYQGEVGDDATFVGVYVRQRHPLIIFSGPPLSPDQDEQFIEKLLDFQGRKVICGGTTGNIVANYLGEIIEMDLATMRKELPPIGMLSGIDLVTEGILTISKATEYIKACDCELAQLPRDRNGAFLLAQEILQADSILFLVGQSINEFYQNPLLPKNISIRRSLIEDLFKFLRDRQKEVAIEYC
jgi:hypothetical protein